MTPQCFSVCLLGIHRNVSSSALAMAGGPLMTGTWPLCFCPTDSFRLSGRCQRIWRFGAYHIFTPQCVDLQLAPQISGTAAQSGPPCPEVPSVSPPAGRADAENTDKVLLPSCYTPRGPRPLQMSVPREMNAAAHHLRAVRVNAVFDAPFDSTKTG